MENVGGKNGPGYETLPNAPITEAVIDFRIALASGSEEETLPRLEQLAQSEQDDRYEYLLTQNLFQGNMRFDEEGLSARSAVSEVVGFQIRDASDHWVASLQLGGLTVSRLRPYETWDALFSEAWRLWERYREAVDPEGVTRLATRFLNHIELPVAYATEDYFSMSIQVPDGIPDLLAAYHQRLVINAGENVRANVSLSSEPVERGAETSRVLFDIDCYRLEDLLPNDRLIPDHLGNLREFKNRIFFKSLTPKALDLFR